MTTPKDLDLNALTVEELASLDLESDKSRDVSGPMARVRMQLKTNLKAGFRGPTIGMVNQE